MTVRRSVFALVIVTILFTAACSNDSASRDSDGRVIERGTMKVFDLMEHDCIVIPDDLETTVEELTVVPCEEPHEAQVYEIIPITDFDVYPGERELSNRAELECIAKFAGFVGVDLADSSLFYTYMLPTVRGWQEDNDRKVVCMILSVGGPMTGTAYQSGRDLAAEPAPTTGSATTLG